MPSAAETAKVTEQCRTQQGALLFVAEIEGRLKRSPPSLRRLREALRDWDKPVPIDDCVRELIDDVDPVVELRGVLVRTLLQAMRKATMERAVASRRTRSTRRMRAVK